MDYANSTKAWLSAMLFLLKEYNYLADASFT